MEPLARTIDAAKKYVVSSTLDRVDWTIASASDAAVEQVSPESDSVSCFRDLVHQTLTDGIPFDRPVSSR